MLGKRTAVKLIGGVILREAPMHRKRCKTGRWLDHPVIYTDFKEETWVNYSPLCRPANIQRPWRKREVARRETQLQQCDADLAQSLAKSPRSTRPPSNPGKQ